MTADEIIAELKPLGKEGYKRILANHGIKEPMFGVSVAELKKFQKRIKRDYQLALDLFDSGIYDAMYLAGLIADDKKMSKRDLQRWADKGGKSMCSFTVPWVAAESNHGREMALKWIDSNKESVAAAGWATLTSLVAIKEDDELDLDELKQLVKRVEKSIHGAPNCVRYAMNNFVISVGCYVKPLSEIALKTAEKIGKVSVDMGNTDCQVPFAPDYIRKVKARGTVGKKRKTCKC